MCIKLQIIEFCSFLLIFCTYFNIIINQGGDFMEKIYYTYSPIKIKEYAYTEEKLSKENIIQFIHFEYVGNGKGICDELASDLLSVKNKFVCYKQDEIFYDLITDFKLTELPNKYEELKENNLYYDPNSLNRINITDALNRIKNIPKKELKNYRKFIIEDVITKNRKNVLEKVHKQEQKINKYLKK